MVDRDTIRWIDPASLPDASRGECTREVREKPRTGTARDADSMKL